jgi:hypothetical protein
MRRSTVKTAFDIKLKGIKIELHKLDKEIKGVTLTDEDGNDVSVYLSNFSMVIDVKAPPHFVEKYQLSGDIKGVKVMELFDTEYEAKSRMIDFSGMSDSLTVEKVQVEQIDDSVNEENCPF